ncbi:MAG TPA: DUF1295 domain-containing protein [Anaerolineae bacterium]|nr:DUF1295 domain-containing protein [Anaerolineae bacterium]
MSDVERQRLMAMPIVLLIGAGLAWLGSQNGVVVGGLPLFTWVVMLAFVIQWVAFVPAYLNQTEHYYDLMGSVTYLSVLVFTVAFNPEMNTRGWLLVGLIAIWTIRLGSFLFLRTRKAGGDGRFDDIKTSWPQFLLVWTLQGLWVTFSVAAALAAMTSGRDVTLGILAFIGTSLWVIGFGIEVVADAQKSAFRAKPENKGKFINTGLWAWSRHPNYFGEILLWIGIAVIAWPALRGWQLGTLISPVFTIILLMRVSGVPMLEARADEKWGGQDDYEAYKENTPVLVPRPPK